jgi:hypothetical protein
MVAEKGRRELLTENEQSPMLGGRIGLWCSTWCGLGPLGDPFLL